MPAPFPCRYCGIVHKGDDRFQCKQKHLAESRRIKIINGVEMFNADEYNRTISLGYSVNNSNPIAPGKFIKSR